jgi:hypothetical protein
LRIEEVENIVEVETSHYEPSCDEDGNFVEEVLVVDTIEENMPTLYALEPFEEFVNGEVIENPNYAQEQAQLKAKELVQKLYDIKAEKAYGGVIINDLLVFETNQVSITNTVASLALMDDTGTSAWKFYTIDGQPTTQQITKIQLLGIAKFGQDMINKAFEVEGNFNNALALATIEELNNPEWCELFIQEAQEAMDLVNNELNVNFINTTPEEESEINSGDGVDNTEPTNEQNSVVEDVTGGEDVNNSESEVNNAT